MKKLSVIIAAAGSGSRMGNIPKQIAELNGKPVIIHSMEVFDRIEAVTEIIVVTRAEYTETIRKAAEKYRITKPLKFAEGGETRQQSVINGLKQASTESGLIAVHDAARPLIKEEHVRRCIRDAEVFGGAALGVPVKDTIKEAEGGLVVDTPDRSRLYIIQTPQIFDRELYVKGVNFALRNELDFTDDCQLVEAVGGKINITLSDYCNIKITTPEDMKIAEILSKNS